MDRPRWRDSVMSGMGGGGHGPSSVLFTRSFLLALIAFVLFIVLGATLWLNQQMQREEGDADTTAIRMAHFVAFEETARETLDIVQSNRNVLADMTKVIHVLQETHKDDELPLLKALEDKLTNADAVTPTNLRDALESTERSLRHEQRTFWGDIEGQWGRLRDAEVEMARKRFRTLSEACPGIDGEAIDLLPKLQFLSVGDGPIDLVYTWVNGSDSKWLQSYRRAVGKKKTVLAENKSSARYADHSTLRLSLRSMEKHGVLDFVRNVYIVTADQVPTWLDVSHPQINVVSHRSIFSYRSHLPTFNSNAIEANLHRISGLAPAYLYFNDDILVNKPMRPRDFVVPCSPMQSHPMDVCGIVLRLSKEYPLLSNITLFRECLKGTKDLIDRVLGEVPDPAYALLRTPYHAPVLFFKDIVEEMERTLLEAWNSTSSHPFRQPSDIHFFFAYQYYLLRKNYKAIIPDEEGVHTVVIGTAPSSELRDTLEAIERDHGTKPFVCVQDIEGKYYNDEEVWNLLDRRLEDWFPRPSRFELPRHQWRETSSVEE